MKLTKEECEKALNGLRILERGENLKKWNLVAPQIKCDLFERLICKHFDNPPLKFEELEEGMWIWDEPYKRYINTGNKHILCEDGKYYFAPFYGIVFCGNLYEFVHTDGFDDGNFIGYEIIVKENFNNRFYRKQVEE